MLENFIATYLEFSQAYNSPALPLKKIKELCTRLEKSSYLELLCKINIALWRHSKDKNLQIELANLLFSKKDAKKVINQAKLRNAFIFYRQQVLYLIKMILLSKTVVGEKLKHANTHKKILGKILLSLNDYTEPMGKYINILLKKSEVESLRQSFTRNWYFIHSGIFFNKIARSLSLWSEIPNTTRGRNLLKELELNPQKEFYEETGLIINDFIGFAMTTLIPYLNIDIKTAETKDFIINKEKFFSKSNISDIEKRKLFEQLLLDKDRFNEMYENFVEKLLDGIDIPEYNFLPIEYKPLLEIYDNLLITIDPIYLTKKVTESVYWILLNRFEKQGEYRIGKGRELSKYYGYLIQEYVYQILINICDDVFEVPSTTEKTADFIGITNYKNKLYLIVIDSKKIALSYKNIILSDRESTLKDLERIFGSKSGFVQIYETIRNLRMNKVKNFNINIKDIDVIFPVLITDREIFEGPFSRHLYENEFLDKHKEGLLYTPHPIISDPLFINLDELEIIESCCNSLGNGKFIEILLKRNELLSKRISRYGIKDIPIEILPLWNHLWELGLMKYKNERLKQTFSNYYKQITKRLFGKESDLILDKVNNYF